MIKQNKMVNHVIKMYSGRTFTSVDFVNSYRLQLIGKKTPPQVRAGMALNKMVKDGVLVVVGEKDTGVRGVNNKVYTLV